MRRVAFWVSLLLLPIDALASGFFVIVDYKPSAFVEQASRPFFYSIGGRLMFGASIDENAPTIFQSKFFDNLDEVIPSPDNSKAIVISGRRFYLAAPGKPPRLILESAGGQVG